MATSKDPVYDKIKEFEEKLKNRKEAALKVRDLRIKGETKVEQLKKQEQEFLDKIRGLGLDPMEMKQYIIDTQKKLTSVLASLDTVLPDENGNITITPGMDVNVNKVDEMESGSGEFTVPEEMDLAQLPTSKPDILPPVQPKKKVETQAPVVSEDVFAELEASFSKAPIVPIKDKMPF